MLVAPAEWSSHAATRPVDVLSNTTLSAAPVPLTVDPNAVQPPWPPLAAGSNLASRIPVPSVQATRGTPSDASAMLGRRDAIDALLLTPPLDALPPSSTH